MTFWKSVCLLAPLAGAIAAGSSARLSQALSQRPGKGHPAAHPSVSATSPRWQYPAAWVGANRIIVTKDTVLLYQEYDGKLVAAVDRATGKERWQHEVLPLSSRPPGIAEEWRQIFAAENNLLIVQIAQVEKVPDTKEQFGYRTKEQSVVRGIDAQTGGTRWQVSAEHLGYPLPTPLQLLGVYGGKIAAVAAGQSIIVVDVATGRCLLSNVEQDRTILQHVSTAIGENSVLLRGQTAWQFLNLGTGEVAATPSLGGVEGMYISGHFVWRIDTDNDAPGGSQFPKWLEAYDRQGKEVWRFPRKTTYRDADHIFATSDSLVNSLHPLPAVGVVLTDTGSQGLIALNAQDGAVLWRKPLRDGWIEPREDGFLLLKTPPVTPGKPAHASLAFVHGRTGRVRWLARFPDSYYFKATGDDLVLLGRDKILRDYNSKAIFQQVPR